MVRNGGGLVVSDFGMAVVAILTAMAALAGIAIISAIRERWWRK